MAGVLPQPALFAGAPPSASARPLLALELLAPLVRGPADAELPLAPATLVAPEPDRVTPVPEVEADVEARPDGWAFVDDALESSGRPLPWSLPGTVPHAQRDKVAAATVQTAQARMTVPSGPRA